MSDCSQHGYYQNVNGCPDCGPTIERENRAASTRIKLTMGLLVEVEVDVIQEQGTSARIPAYQLHIPAQQVTIQTGNRLIGHKTHLGGLIEKRLQARGES